MEYARRTCYVLVAVLLCVRGELVLFTLNRVNEPVLTMVPLVTARDMSVVTCARRCQVVAGCRVAYQATTRSCVLSNSTHTTTADDSTDTITTAIGLTGDGWLVYDKQEQSPVTSRCDEGWAYYGDSCYVVLAGPRNREMSVVTCAEMSANLSTITSAEENYFVQGLANHTLRLTGDTEIMNEYFTYLGGSDILEEGTWVWENEDIVVGNWFWNPKEPNGGDAENCMAMFPVTSENFGKWADVPCDWNGNCVCEKASQVLP